MFAFLFTILHAVIHLALKGKVTSNVFNWLICLRSLWICDPVLFKHLQGNNGPFQTQ